jgi:TolA-binding protein
MPGLALGLVCFARVLAAVLLVQFAAVGQGVSEETNAPQPGLSMLVQTNAQAIIQAFLQLQQQLHATQLAIEENRREIKEATAQNAEALSTALQTIQDNFTAQRARDLQAMQQHNKVVLILVGSFAGMGFLTMLMMSYFQWRMSKGLAEISAALPAALGLGHGSAPAALGAGRALGARLIGSSAPSAKPLPDPDTAFRRRQLRALRTAVIVGLICAAALALLFYFVTYRKLGFGYLHGWFKS